MIQRICPAFMTTRTKRRRIFRRSGKPHGSHASRGIRRARSRAVINQPGAYLVDFVTRSCDVGPDPHLRFACVRAARREADEAAVRRHLSRVRHHPRGPHGRHLRTRDKDCALPRLPTDCRRASCAFRTGLRNGLAAAFDSPSRSSPTAPRSQAVVDRGSVTEGEEEAADLRMLFADAQLAGIVAKLELAPC